MLPSEWEFTKQLIDYAKARSSRLRDESGAISMIELVIIVAVVVVAALAVIQTLTNKAKDKASGISF